MKKYAHCQLRPTKKKYLILELITLNRVLKLVNWIYQYLMKFLRLLKTFQQKVLSIEQIQSVRDLPIRNVVKTVTTRVKVVRNHNVRIIRKKAK